ncbi:MAG: 4-hydroxy-tetrahydrodipicolinate reductase [Pirellulales bacterium]
MAIRIGINGAAGRMGQRLIALAAADPELNVAAALEHAANPKLGGDAGTIAGIGPVGVALAGQLTAPIDVMIDFSVPQATATVREICVEKKIPLVVATTGLPAELQEKIRAAAQTIPVLWAPSMSLAVNLAMRLAEMAGRALAEHPAGADVEIIEKHHRFKEDAPSGTALKFGEIIAGVMGQKDARHGRSGRPGQRPHGEIAYHAVRTGDNPGEHTVIFGLLGETLELTVRATNRDCYAHGALAAAKFLAGKPPGLYSMNDVLKLG